MPQNHFFIQILEKGPHWNFYHTFTCLPVQTQAATHKQISYASDANPCADSSWGESLYHEVQHHLAPILGVDLRL